MERKAENVIESKKRKKERKKERKKDIKRAQIEVNGLSLR